MIRGWEFKKKTEDEGIDGEMEKARGLFECSFLGLFRRLVKYAPGDWLMVERITGSKYLTP